MSTSRKILVLGGGYAGILGALRLAGKTRRAGVEITLVNGSDTFVERIRLHQLAAGQSLSTLSIPRLLKRTGIQFVQGWATAINPNERYVHVQCDHGEITLTYDNLVYALGSSVDMESIDGVAEYTTALGSRAMVDAMQKEIPALAQKNGRVVIVGGGLTGIEAATELAESYPTLDVTLLTRGPLGSDLSAIGKAHLATVFTRLGIHVEDGAIVAHVQPGHVLCADGSRRPFDLCIWSAGFSVPQLAAISGLATDEKGRVLVDQQLRSASHPSIYAVGDCAQTPLRMACATAMPMGCHAADHLAASIRGQSEPKPFRFGYAIRCISLGRKDALVQDVDAYDLPKDRVFTGKTAVIIKELICRLTIWALRIERRLPGAYQWPKAVLSWDEKRSEVTSRGVNTAMMDQAMEGSMMANG